MHPVRTGTWLQHLYTKAWQAQTDPYYTDHEKGQILAFVYGYMTHAAGDMWAHTLVNDLSGGVFPGVSEILSDKSAAEIALRHIILEGYIGDATAGYDGNDERGPAPNGDVSDDSSPGIPFAAPHRFLYRTLVDPQTLTPLCVNARDDDHDGVVNDGCPGGPAAVDSSEGSRGPLIDFFLDLRSGLQAFLASNPQPLQDALAAYDDTKQVLDAAADDCNFAGVDDVIHDLVACPLAIGELIGTAVIESAEAFANFVASTLYAAAKVVFDAYVAEWIADIDRGLEHWSELGLASTKALFDPQTRRDAQNYYCAHLPGENTQSRADCEDGVGSVQVLLYTSIDFISEYLIPMLGAPDVLGDVAAVAFDFAHLLNALLIPFNPIIEGLAVVSNFAKGREAK